MISEYTVFDISVGTELIQVINWINADIRQFTHDHIFLLGEEYFVDYEIEDPDEDRGQKFNTIYFWGLPWPLKKFNVKQPDGKIKSVDIGNGTDKRERIFLGFIEIRPLAEERVQLVGFLEEYVFEDYLIQIGKKIATIFPTFSIYLKGEKPDAPVKPQPDAPLQSFFDYYHECKRTDDVAYTLKELAEDTNMSYSYIRKLHMVCSICHPPKIRNAH